MSDQEKRAQLAWANLGGLGPVPEYLATGEPFESSGGRLLGAKRVIAGQRHDLRTRLIVAGVAAGKTGGGAIHDADDVLARLDAEAKVGA